MKTNNKYATPCTTDEFGNKGFCPYDTDMPDCAQCQYDYVTKPMEEELGDYNNQNENMEDETMMKEVKTIATMKDYKAMKWQEVVAYAKELGINTGHKKRVVIESEIDIYFESLLVGESEDENTVSVGDMSSDKYYPELQQEEETKEPVKDETKPISDIKKKLQDNIITAINKVKYNATYNGAPVTYINKQALRTIIKRNIPYNKLKGKTQADVTKLINQVIIGMMKQGILYSCESKQQGAPRKTYCGVK